jgi:hypothetical protein
MAAIKAISMWIYPTSGTAEQMLWYVSEDRELYSSFGSNYYFSFPRSCIRTNIPAPQINQWHSIIVNLTGNKFQLFVDGNATVEVACSSSVSLNNEIYYIGSKGGSGYYFRGKMDDYKIFSRSLTAQEIEELSRE